MVLWKTIDRSPASLKFRALTTQLLRIGREKIVPLIEAGFVSAERTLVGRSSCTGRLDIRWKTASGDTLQIVANFGELEIPLPKLIEGENLWQSGLANWEALLPDSILVRHGCEG
jgi:maltooligosyltrehalose trehalohydrolase